MITGVNLYCPDTNNKNISDVLGNISRGTSTTKAHEKHLSGNVMLTLKLFRNSYIHSSQTWNLYDLIRLPCSLRGKSYFFTICQNKKCGKRGPNSLLSWGLVVIKREVSITMCEINDVWYHISASWHFLNWQIRQDKHLLSKAATSRRMWQNIKQTQLNGLV